MNIDPAAAARYMSTRLWLPLVRLPVLGVGVALALSGWLWSGFALIALGTIAPIVIRRSAPHFVLTQALEDERFYEDAVRSGVLDVTTHTPHAPSPERRANNAPSPFGRGLTGRELWCSTPSTSFRIRFAREASSRSCVTITKLVPSV